MLVIGVDPGLTGALCLLDSQRGLLECEDIPVIANGQDSGSMKRWVDADLLEILLRDWSAAHDFARNSLHAAIERPIPMPTLPAQTIASQFDTFGVLRSMLRQHAAMCYVNPREWKKFFGLKTDKNAARECCLRLYPSAPVKRVKDHNRAESVLIGHWLLREIA
jgi:hypothetical protein